MTNKVVLGDGTDMTPHLPDGCVALVVTSPPQDISAGRHGGLGLDEYLAFLRGVWAECRRVLREGGRLCVNVAGVQGESYVPLHSHIEHQLIEDGWLMLGTVIWHKTEATGKLATGDRPGTPHSPGIREVHEHVLVFSKDERGLELDPGDPELGAEEMTELSKSVWVFPAESPKRVGHPAPFPEELPHRLIKLYSRPGDLILDPFVGSGTTCAVAKKLGRRWFGIDSNPDYVLLAHERIRSTVGG